MNEKEINIKDYVIDLFHNSDTEINFEVLKRDDLTEYNRQFWDFLKWNLGHEVWEGDYDQHRWVTHYTRIIKIPGDRFISVNCIMCDENQDPDDYYSFNYKEDIIEVFPVEVKAVIYKTKEELEKK